MHKSNAHVCDCEVLAHERFAGEQYVLTLKSLKIAKLTKPGQFVHIKVSAKLSMRTPISIMLVDIDNAAFSLLYKVVGKNTAELSKRKIGEILSIIGPIGNGFNITNKKSPLLIGGGVGMPPIIAMAQQIKNSDYDPLVILGSEIPFPFTTKLSAIGPTCSQASHTMPLLENWGVACRLTSMQNYTGAYKGYATDLAKIYLDSLTANELTQIEIYCCGPHSMLQAASKLANQYNLPCQVCLEEHMACAVGGCAGCVVPVTINNITTMKRVCVDGPVFIAETIFYD